VWEVEFGLPDHELVVSAAVNVIGIRRCENVICNVAAHVVGVVFPFDRGRHALDLADQIAFVEDAACICIALDIILAAVPGPLGAPLDAGARCTVVVCALRPRSGSVLAPEVVQDFVAVGGVVGVLGAETDGFLDGADLADGGRAYFAGGNSCDCRRSERGTGVYVMQMALTLRSRARECCY
jgi:hypothetical protein